jgi:glutathione synthase
MVLFVVQETEINAFDQRRLEYHLLEKHCIHILRMTLFEIGTMAKLDRGSRLLVPVAADNGGTQEISVVYFRAGYIPGDYSSNTQWEARRLLESSRAIKCPTIITQLTGCKKVQQALTIPGVLERYHFVFTQTESGSSIDEIVS